MGQSALERLQASKRGKSALERLREAKAAKAAQTDPSIGERLIAAPGQFGRAYGRSLLIDPIEGVGTLLGGGATPEFVKKGADIARGVLDTLNPIPESVAQEADPPFLQGVPGALGGTAGVAASALLGGLGAGAATAGIGGGMGTYREAKEKGADDATALTAFALSIPVNLLDVIPGSAAVKAAKLGSTLNKLNTASKGALGKWLAGSASTPAVEAGQSGVQRWLENLIASTTGYDPERKQLDGVPQETLMGLLVGTGVGGAHAAATGQLRKERKSALDRLRESRLAQAQPQPGTSPNPPSLDPSAGETAAAVSPITDQAQSPEITPFPESDGGDSGAGAAPASVETGEPTGFPWEAPLEERLAMPAAKEHLKAMAAESGWFEAGGQMIRNAGGDVVGRTPWAPRAEWWTSRPVDMTEAELKKLVARVVSGEQGRMGHRQRLMLDWMLGQPTQVGDSLWEPGQFDEGGPPASVPPETVTSEAADIPGFEIPDETRTQNLRQRYVNDFERQNVLEEVAPNKVEGEQVSSLYRRMAGIVSGAHEVIEKTIWRPTVKALRKSGIDSEVSKPGLPSVKAYSTAIGAPERNETMMRRSGVENGSGMSTEDAKRIVAEAESSPHAAEYIALKERIAKLNEDRLTDEVESGLQSPEWREQVEKDFGRYYSPMQTVDETDRYFAGSSGIHLSGPEFRRATGRTSQAFNPFIQNVVSRQVSATRAARNRVARRFAEWIRINPTLGRIVDSLAEVSNEDRIAKRVVGFKENGQYRYAILADQRLADSARLLEADKIDDTLRAADKALNWLRRANTSWNPVFWMSNFPRDVGLAFFKMSVDESVAFAADVVRTVPAAVRAMRRVQANDAAPGALEDSYRLLREQGGFTSKADLSSMQKRLEDVQSELAAGVTRQAATKLGRYFLDLNNAFEYATRLAVGHVALQRGKSVADAALASRTATADFARRGEKSAFWSRVYLFFNANVQGTASVVESFAKHPQRGATAAGALVGMGYLFALMSRSLADEDDDGISMWEKIPEYDKSRKLGIMLGDKLYGIPSPWGFGFFSGLGVELEAMNRGGQSFEKTASKVLASLLDNTSPLPAGSLSMQFTPTALRPFHELAANENFAGSPIMPTRNPFEAAELQPDSEQHFKNVNPQLASLFSGINRATGGDTMRAGAVDVSPETAEHMLGWIGGGLGRFAGRTFNLAGKMIRADSIYTSDYPGLRAFVSEVPEFDTSRRYYDTLRKIEAAHARAMARSGMSDDDRFYLRFDKAAREIDKRVTLLRKANRPDEEIDAVRKKLNAMVQTAKEQK
jgi:hypothetical protein